MLQSDLSLFACPFCLSAGLAHKPAGEPLETPPGFDPGRHFWEGALVCPQCGRAYPLLEGVACLGLLNRDWRIPLKETSSKLSVSLRLTRKTHWEVGRQEAFDQQAEQVSGVMDRLFECALDELDFSARPVVLDLGCGGGPTTDRFAALGARPVGIDTDIGQLRYISFKGIDALPPRAWRHPESGHLFHEKEPRALENYFTRVFADICRLPFIDGAFDMIFCRSVLHHLDDHRRILQGAMRVLRPGGKAVFCSEPMRSILTIEAERMEDAVQCEEGMNERVWPLWHYMSPVWPFTRRVMVHTWAEGPSPSLTRRSLGLAGRLKQRIGPGARVRGWQLPALALVDGSFNMYAERNGRPAPAPQAGVGSALPDQDFAELVELFRVRPGEDGAGPADLPRKRSVTERLRRDLMEHCDALPPQELRLAAEPQFTLENGWLRVIELGGRQARLASWDTAVFLARRAGARQVIVTATRAGGGDARLSVTVNDQPAGEVKIDSSAWREYAFALPEGLEAAVLTVRLNAQLVGDEASDTPPLAIERIGQR